MNLPPNLKRVLDRAIVAAKEHSRLTVVGAILATLLLVNLGSHENSSTQVIIKHEGVPDFKGASILGNPSQHILAGQEQQFSKNAQKVLSNEAKLQAQVAALQAEVDRIKNTSPLGFSGLASPLPSPLASSAQLGAAIPQETYGPPSPEASFRPIRLFNSQETFGSTQIQDRIHETHAAPESASRILSADTLFRKLPPGKSMISFPAKSVPSVVFQKPSIVLPSGSYVKGKLMTGVEAPEGKTYPVLLQMDYAYIIPNKKRLDLTGCFMIAKATGNLSTERVEMQPTKLSCVSKHGGMFEREVNGFVADDVDNSFAVIGSVNSKQDRVAVIAFLSSIVAGVGKAIQQAQTTQQTTPLGGSQTVLTGDQGKFIAAAGASDAGSMVANWYLKHAEALLPTINVGSGQNVWMVMTEKVDLPKDYFTQKTSEGGNTDASLFSYLTSPLN